MKHDLTTGTWQDDTGCPISIIFVATSDGCSTVEECIVCRALHRISINIK